MADINYFFIFSNITNLHSLLLSSTSARPCSALCVAAVECKLHCCTDDERQFFFPIWWNDISSNFRIKTWNEAKFYAQRCSSFIHRNDPRDDSSLSSLDGNCHVQRDRRVECRCRVWVEWLQERRESSYLLIIQDALLSERLKRFQLNSTLYVALRLASFLILAQIIFNLLNQSSSSSSCFSFLACRCCLRCLIMQKHFFLFCAWVECWLLSSSWAKRECRVSFNALKCFENFQFDFLLRQRRRRTTGWRGPMLPTQERVLLILWKFISITFVFFSILN